MSLGFSDLQNYNPGDVLDRVFLIAGQGDDEISAAEPTNADRGVLTEVPADEFPLYFVERDGRLFHSHGTSPYPLPADTPEQERLNVQHRALNQLIGANYVGPVPDVLVFDPGRQKLTIDLCTGTGKWPMEMASEFPHVLFRGLDIVPIATRYPLPNVQFEVHDINDQCRWNDNAADFVHARSISMAISDYSAILREVGRILRPGGLFTSCEWGRYPAFHPSFNLHPAYHVPGICRFFEILHKALDMCRGIQPLAPSIPSLLVASGLFTEITPQFYYMPIGPWHTDFNMQRLGRAYRATLLRYADSTRPLLMEAGWTDAELDDIIGGYVHDLKTVRGLVSVYHTVHARKA